MNVDKLLEDIDWDKYFDVDVFLNLKMLIGMKIGMRLESYVALKVCVVFPRLI